MAGGAQLFLAIHQIGGNIRREGEAVRQNLVIRALYDDIPDVGKVLQHQIDFPVDGVEIADANLIFDPAAQ